MKYLPRFFYLVMFLLVTKISFSKNPHPVNTGSPLYLSTNKELYAPDETVCFQAFLVVGAPNSTALSSIIVELYSCTGYKIISKKLPLLNDMAAGSFTLPGLNDDYYLLYCYTITSDGKRGADFTKKVTVKDNNIANTAPANNLNYAVDDIAVDYFFEGGTFVSELSNNILIKTTTQGNKPVSVFGKIVNEKDEVVSVFKTNEQGIINASCIPYQREKLSIIIKDNLNNIKKVALPVASSEGVILKVLYVEKSIFYVAQLNSRTYATPKEYTLNLIYNNDIIFQSTLKFCDGKCQIKDELPIADLPDGYLTFSITDNDNKKYAERLFYNSVNSSKINSIKLVDSIAKKTYNIDLPNYISGKGYIAVNAGEKNKLDLIDANAAYIGQNLETPALNNVVDFNKFNDFLISLKSPVADAANNQPAQNQFLTISGTLYNRDDKPIKNKKVNIIINDSKTKNRMYETETDEKGRLRLANLLFYDTATVYYQLANKSEEKNNVKLLLDKNTDFFIQQNNGKIKEFLCANTVDENNSSGLINTKNEDKKLIAAKNSKILDGVTVKSTIQAKTDKEVFVDKHVSGGFNFTPMVREEFDFISNPKDEIDYESVANFISGRLPGIQIRNIKPKKDDFNIIDMKLINLDILLLDRTHPPVQIYIDETEVGPEELPFIFVRDCALIRFYGTGWRPRSGGPSGGTLVIYTRRGNEHSEKLIKGLPKLKMQGYDFDKSQINNSTQPANYKKLFWEPNYSFAGNKIIYVNLLPEIKGNTVEVKMEGINDNNIPFTFIKKITVD